MTSTVGTHAALPGQPERCSLRAFARRMRLAEGVIRKGIRSGRLERSVGRDARGRPFIADVALAEVEWRTNADPSKGEIRGRALDRTDIVPGKRPRGSVSLFEYKRKIAAEDLRTRRIKNDLATGTLALVRPMQLAVAAMFTMVKTGCLAYPTRAKQALPHLTAPDVVVLDRLMREILEELSVSKVPGLEE